MSGVPVVLSPRGIPVRQVASGAPVMTVAANGRGMAVNVGSYGPGFVIQGSTPTVSGMLPDGTAGQPYAAALTVIPGGTPVTVTVTKDGVPTTLAAHGLVHDGFGGFSSAGLIL